MLYKKLVFCIFMLICGTVYAEQSVNDCILSGVRIANNDAAVRLIKQTCESKFREQTYQEFGEIVSDELTLKNWKNDGRNIIATFLNNSDKTTTLVKVYVSKASANGLCNGLQSKQFIYKVKLKQNASGNFIIPAGELITEKAQVCFEAYSRLARSSRWGDISLGSYSPISADELDMFVVTYSFKLGYRFEP